MKRIIIMFAGVLMFVVGITSAAEAQGLTLGINGGTVVPIGDFSDIAETGFGGNVSLGYRLTESWALKLMAGYHQFGEKEIGPFKISGAFIPIRIGLRKFWGASKRFYTSPQLGIFIGADDFDSEDFGMGPRIGYQFPFGGENTKIDVGVEFNNVFADVPDDKDVQYFGIDIGVEFGLGGLYF